MCGALEDLMILVGSVLWNASVTLIKNKDVYYDSQLSVRASRGNENNVCRGSANVHVLLLMLLPLVLLMLILMSQLRSPFQTLYVDLQGETYLNSIQYLRFSSFEKMNLYNFAQLHLIFIIMFVFNLILVFIKSILVTEKFVDTRRFVCD